jgi:uncharacterized protein
MNAMQYKRQGSGQELPTSSIDFTLAPFRERPVRHLVRRFGAVVALSVVIAAGAACAQNAEPDQSESVRMALARQMIEQNGGEQAARTQLNMMLAIIKKNAAQAMPGDESALDDKIFDDVVSKMNGLVPKILDVSAKVYAKNYTEKELRDIIAFEQSDTGRSVIAKTPKVRAEAMNATMPLMMKLMPDVMRKTVDRVCEVNHCTANERALVEAALAKALQRTSP